MEYSKNQVFIELTDSKISVYIDGYYVGYIPVTSSSISLLDAFIFPDENQIKVADYRDKRLYCKSSLSL